MTSRLALAAAALLAISAGTELAARAAAPERAVHVVDASRAPDLFVQTSFDDAAQEKILAELRAAVKAGAGIDPLDHRFDRKMVFPAKINTKMGALVKTLVQRLVNFEFGAAEAVIEIEGLHYASPKASLRVGRATARPDGLDLPVSFRMRETAIVADRIRITFRTNTAERSFLNKFYVELRGTKLVAERLDSLALDLTVNARTAADGSTTFTLPRTSFSTFESLDAEKLKTELQLAPGEITTSSMSLNIGRTELPLNKEGFKALLELRKAEIADLVFDPLVEEIKRVPERLMKSKKDSIVAPGRMEFELPCLGKTAFKLVQYGQIGATQLMLGFGIFHPEYSPAAESPRTFVDSGDALHDRIDRRDVSTAFGLRDRFIAWALERSVRGCLKEKIPPTLRLGPEGVRARMGPTDGDDGTIAIHAQTPMKGFKRTLLNTRLLEFPVKVAPKLDFRSGGDEPAAFVLDFSRPDLSDKILLEGYDGIPSKLGRRILNRKVKGAVEKQLREGLARAKIEIPLTFLSTPDVSYANIASDRHGHLNLFLSLNPGRAPGEAHFWANMAPYLRKIFVPRQQTPGAPPPTGVSAMRGLNLADVYAFGAHGGDKLGACDDELPDGDSCPDGGC